MRRPATLLALCLVAAVFVKAQPFQHPCMLHTEQELNRVKQQLMLSPLKEAYTHLTQSKFAQTSYKESTAALGPDGTLKRMDLSNWGPNGRIAQYDDYSNYAALMRDAAACYQLALRYRLSGDTRFADTAVRVLNAWAANCKGMLRLPGYVDNIPDPNEYLINLQAHQLANAAELLRDYSGWAAADFQKFQLWMRQTFAEVAKLFLEHHSGHQGDKHYWLNWDLAQMTALLAIGILCDDADMVAYAIDYYKTASDEVGYVRNAVPFLHKDPDSDEWLGQCQESGRDQGHATLCVSLLGAFCQMALSVGYDLFAHNDYRALSMAEYVAKYNLMTDATFNSSTPQFAYADSRVPFAVYNPNDIYYHSCLSEVGRGTKRPCWELFARYAKDHGRKTAYVDRWTEQMQRYNGWGDGGAGDYGNNSGGFDQLGYGTLMFALPNATVGLRQVASKNSHDDYCDLSGRRTSRSRHGIYVANHQKRLYQ